MESKKTSKPALKSKVKAATKKTAAKKQQFFVKIIC
jgi:hypothetical protein